MPKVLTLHRFYIVRAVILLALAGTNYSYLLSQTVDIDSGEIRLCSYAGKNNKVLSNFAITNSNKTETDKPLAELLFYPQFRFKNSRLDRIYLLQLNVNPTLHLRLWKGAAVTAQVIFPIYNDYSNDESKIRPGFLTLSQILELPAGIKMMATAGNFNMQRAGGDLKLYREVGSRAGVYAQAGITYWSIPFFDSWTTSQNNRFNWRFGANYMMESSRILLNANVSQYLENDIALRGEIIRYFKNATVGFYVQTLQHEGYFLNGGFFFTISLPPRKRSNSKNFIIAPSQDFSLDYVARPYPTRGVYYRTSPAENSSHNFFNNFLLNKKTKY